MARANRRKSASGMATLARMGSMEETVVSSVGSPFPTRSPTLCSALPAIPVMGEEMRV